MAKLPTRPTLITLAFRHGMGYHYLNVCINSANDASISCKNFVNFGPITPELIKLICELLIHQDKKWCIQPNISGYTGLIFAIFSQYQSALGADN